MSQQFLETAVINGRTDALLSVTDKTGLAEFAQGLEEIEKFRIISTGHTADSLTQAGINVTKVEEVTGFPEILGGRVKTLHPKIFGGILADIKSPDHLRDLEIHDITPVDMVVVNLY